MDIGNLGNKLLKAGAPVLKSVIESSIGGIGGKLAGVAIDALAEALGTEATPAAIERKIDADPVGSAARIQSVETVVSDEVARIAEANRDVMVSYHQVLREDASSEGWLSRNWRNMFAIVFTICIAGITLTFCRAIWIGQLDGIDKVASTIALIILAGCAVLGVQVWQRTEEKKAGV